ncbi:hypothetical protein [Paenibacillus anseongense]|nr:hypothetical protein [Paenibacillus anseongense]MEC0269401.1 hypothetical protein [Paenibacillus anseongense]
MQKQIGGFDECYLDELDPKAPDFLEKYFEKVLAPVEPDKKDSKN